jgi:hypothetical protein
VNAGETLALSPVDRAFYAALKLHVYGTLDESLLTTLLQGKPVTIGEPVRLEFGRFTARKAANLFVGENGNRPKTSAEFYGFTSHKVREKLAQFSEMGVLEFVGQGLRDAFTYKWSRPIKHWDICSFLRVKRATGDDLSLNLELSRVYHGLGFEPFTFNDFVGLYEDAHSAEFGGSRWGRRKYEALRNSFGYQSFLRLRLDRLIERKLVDAPEKDQFTLNRAVSDVMNHFDLFVNDVAYHPSREMCAACKLDGLCRAGSTQLLVVAMNRSPRAMPGNGAMNGNGNGNGNGHSNQGVNGNGNGNGNGAAAAPVAGAR